ncbi:MAG: hypothetical protein ABIP49_02570 [Lysobacterales bacterium]
MRVAYYGGAPGMLTSSLVWFVAAVVAVRMSASAAVLALFVGGMLIHPVSVVLCKAFGRSAAHSKGNPFGGLAMASTGWLILSLPLAYVVSLYRMEWFFPAMLFVIGGRYLTFAIMFGSRVFLGCGVALAAGGYVLAKFGATAAVGALTGSAIEAVFGLFILRASRLQRT